MGAGSHVHDATLYHRPRLEAEEGFWLPEVMASIDKRPSLNCLRLRGPCDPTSKHNPGHEHLCAGSGFTASRFGQAEVNNYANVDLICKIAQAQKAGRPYKDLIGASCQKHSVWSG